jgi:hypothetical protein
MLDRVLRGVSLLVLAACSGASPEDDALPASTSEQGPETVIAPALGATPSGPAPLEPAFATFLDPETGLGLQDVRDADREIIRFDLENQAMIWAANGNPVGGWLTTGNELRWQRSGVAFRVRFGSEAGERRAYFTEADRGTICNLSISAPEQLSISPTSETPPG